MLLTGDALKDVRDKGVEDRHGLLGDANLRVHLLEHLVDVDAVGLYLACLAALLLLTNSLGSLCSALLYRCLCHLIDVMCSRGGGGPLQRGSLPRGNSVFGLKKEGHREHNQSYIMSGKGKGM